MGYPRETMAASGHAVSCILGFTPKDFAEFLVEALRRREAAEATD
jgi:hypothetical protein